MFGPWVEFGQGGNGILLEALRSRCAVAGIRSRDGAAREAVPRTDTFASRRDPKRAGPLVVYDLLVSPHASSDQVASRLGISWRTLHRQLARDGESFSSAGYVEDKKLALSEVAHPLGFSELSAFSRWFRAEFDCSPTSWRMAGRGYAQGSSSPSPRH